MNNIPELKAIKDDPGQLANLPLDVVAILIDEAKETKALGDTVAKIITASLEQRFASRISFAYQTAKKDTGTVYVEAGEGYELEACRTKRVEWAQDQLAQIRRKIGASGDDPAEYIGTTFTIEERKYTAWPEHIRLLFEAARTMRPGPLTLKLRQREAA